MKTDRSKPTKEKRIKRLCIILIIGLLCFAFCWYENNHLVVTEYNYYNEKLPEQLDGYRIVMISDLHNAEFGTNNEKLLSRIQELKPDIIVITGDIVDSSHTNIDAAINVTENAMKICPVYYVTGNHEYWLTDDDFEKLKNGMRDVGVKILDNEISYIGTQESTFAIIGLNDKSLQNQTLKNLVQESGGKMTLVLAHEPQYFSQYANAGADLVLAGHAHGGQFRLPFIGGVIAPDQGFAPEYTEGEFFEGNTEMIVSRGLGNSVVPVRLFNDPEIVFIELHMNE